MIQILAIADTTPAKADIGSYVFPIVSISPDREIRGMITSDATERNINTAKPIYPVKTLFSSGASCTSSFRAY